MYYTLEHLWLLYYIFLSLDSAKGVNIVVDVMYVNNKNSNVCELGLYI